MTWDNKFFGECAELIKDIVQPSDALGSPYIGLEHISQGKLSLLGFGKSDDVISAKSRFRKGDILFGKLRPYFRKVIIAPFDGVCSTDIWVVRAKSDIYQKFLFYWMASEEFVETSSRAAEGTKMPRAQWEYVERIQQDVPDENEQRSIAGILGALDDKIEVNRRMNATLETMARAVFQEMVKDGEGEEKTIGAVVTVVGGSTPSTTNSAFWDGGDIHWATPKDLAPLQSPILLDTNSRITELGLREISSGLLQVGTVLLSSRAPIGYLVITHIPVAINQGFIAIKCMDEVPNYFILNWLKENMEEIVGRANGTTFLEISKSNFRPMKFIVPPPNKIKVFVDTVEPLYQKIVVNLKESRTLASLRDSLLPKLMRGEVRVREPDLTGLSMARDEWASSKEKGQSE
jgi:type I restriction enzyme S subunit